MNIYNFKPPTIDEDFHTLFKGKNLEIIRIVSSDKLEVKEYNQKEDEFVVLLEGNAKLEIEGKVKELKKGDYIHIPAFTKHKVLQTSKGTLWLAIHFKNS